MRQWPYAELSRLRLAKPPPSKRRFAGEDPQCNGGCPPARTAGRSNPYRRGQIMIDRGIPSTRLLAEAPHEKQTNNPALFA